VTRALIVALVAAACSRDRATPRDAAPLGEDLGRRLTEAECDRAIDHALALVDDEPGAGDHATQLRGDRAARIAACVEVGTLRDHRCLMAARSFQDLGGCAIPGAASR
jgi:hypothetical protein